LIVGCGVSVVQVW